MDAYEPTLDLTLDPLNLTVLSLSRVILFSELNTCDADFRFGSPRLWQSTTLETRSKQPEPDAVGGHD
jgi:hypothetical protein